MRALAVAAVFILALGLASCGQAEPAVMPDVTGQQLDVAKSDIGRAGHSGDVEVVGGGLFGVVDESNWTVCEQLPSAGETVTGTPRLTVDRTCDEDADSAGEAPAEESTPAATPGSDGLPAGAVVTETTTDELFDMTNEGALANGDFYRFTAVMVRPDLWGYGIDGEFTVYAEAKNGTNDILVFVDEQTATAWDHRTVVEMVVEVVENTIDGETTDGWLRAVTTRVVD